VDDSIERRLTPDPTLRPDARRRGSARHACPRAAPRAARPWPAAGRQTVITLRRANGRWSRVAAG